MVIKVSVLVYSFLSYTSNIMWSVINAKIGYYNQIKSTVKMTKQVSIYAIGINKFVSIVLASFCYLHQVFTFHQA